MPKRHRTALNPTAAATAPITVAAALSLIKSEPRTTSEDEVQRPKKKHKSQDKSPVEGLNLTFQEEEEYDGRYIYNQGDVIDSRWNILNKKLGSGTYGDCYLGYDFKLKKNVALKLIRKTKSFSIQGIQEIQINNTISYSKNYNPDYQVIMLDNTNFKGHIVIVYELLGQDLHTKIISRPIGSFPMQEIQVMMTSILNCLEILSKCKIVHGDLKPENILESQENKYKVIDFGSSFYCKDKIDCEITSLYWRAPEVVLGLPYGPEIDMWALGCILYEIVCGRPLFAAYDELELLETHIKYLGLPEKKVIDTGRRSPNFFKEDGTPYDFEEPKVPNALDASFPPSTDENIVDFIKQCLKWDPSLRMTPSQGLNHSLIKNNYNQSNNSCIKIMTSI